jgi:hypothetical protein
MRIVPRLLSNESWLSVFKRKILPEKGPQMALFWVLSPRPTRDPGIICLDDCPPTSLGLKMGMLLQGETATKTPL